MIEQVTNTEELDALLKKTGFYYTIYYLSRHTSMNSGWVNNSHYSQPCIKKHSVLSDTDLNFAIALSKGYDIYMSEDLVLFIKKNDKLFSKIKTELIKGSSYFKQKYVEFNHPYWF